jgi:hypothetical protein
MVNVQVSLEVKDTWNWRFQQGPMRFLLLAAPKRSLKSKRLDPLKM